MPASIATLLLICAAVLAATSAITWWTTRWWYGRQLAEVRLRSRQAELSLREKQAALIAQVDALRREVREQKALVASMSAKGGAPKPPTPREQVDSLLSEPFITSRSPRKPQDFEDTQIL